MCVAVESCETEAGVTDSVGVIGEEVGVVEEGGWMEGEMGEEEPVAGGKGCEIRFI